MSIEKRIYPRFYFVHDQLPILTLQVSQNSEIPAELLNISSGGMCLSISQDQDNFPRHLNPLMVINLTLDNGLTIQNTALKLCYSYRAKDLKKMILGLEFCDFTPKKRQEIETFIQERSEKDEQIL